MKSSFTLFFAGLLAVASFSASASEPVAPKHQERGLECANCHTTPAKPDFNKCIECHGGLEALTAQDKPQHAMLKNGPIPCTTCHQGHPKK